MNIGVVDVQIVRPKKTFLENIALLLSRFLIGGWIVMLILGAITDLHVSYGHSVLFVWLVRILVADGDYLMWSKDAK
jgi:hypothetical protein